MGLPSLAQYPQPEEIQTVPSAEWRKFLITYATLCDEYLRLPLSQFRKEVEDSGSIIRFLSSFVSTSAQASNEELSRYAKGLRQQCFLLTHRIWTKARSVPSELTSPRFVRDFCTIYAKVPALDTLVESTWTLFSLESRSDWIKDKTDLENSLEFLVKAKSVEVEELLRRIVALLRCCDKYGRFLMTGTDLLDALILSWRRSANGIKAKLSIISYLCLNSLIQNQNQSMSLLIDHLYTLRTDAEKMNVTQSLLGDLISTTPFLGRMQTRIEISDSGRARSTFKYLTELNIPHYRPNPRKSRNNDKGKGVDYSGYESVSLNGISIHRSSLITQIQDLFPDLGSAFIVNLLDEYEDDTEEVIAHLLEDSLPSHLKAADKYETLRVPNESDGGKFVEQRPSVFNNPTVPNRKNVFDGDDFDHLKVDAGKIHVGRKEFDAPLSVSNKASILAALAAIDPDDDERDDTYDGDDVGGTVDTVAVGSDEVDGETGEQNEEVLFKSWKSFPEYFDRTADARRSEGRETLRLDTGMTDEAIEGWAIMAGRKPEILQRLEAKYSTFSGQQQELASTAWKAGQGDDEEDEQASHVAGHRNRSGRGARGYRGHKRGKIDAPGSVNEESIQREREKKGAAKAYRANHNRREGRAKKVARAGFSG